MSAFYISYEVSSSLSSPERAKCSSKNTKLPKVKRVEALSAGHAGNHTPSITSSSPKRISSIFRSRQPSPSPSPIAYSTDAEYYSFHSPCNPPAGVIDSNLPMLRNILGMYLLGIFTTWMKQHSFTNSYLIDLEQYSYGRVKSKASTGWQ